MLQYIPSKLGRVLDIGCSNGELGLLLKQEEIASEVTGIEISNESYQAAKSKLDHVIHGNVEDMKFPFEERYFDTIIFADSIEHTLNPWLVIETLSSYLKNGGKIIAFIPNTRNWKVVFSLLFNGNWEYADWGLLDRTHLRFFTKKSIPGLFDSNIFSLKLNAYIEKNSYSELINFATLGIFNDFLSSHYIVIATKI